MDAIDIQLKKLEGYLQAIQDTIPKEKVRYWIISWDQFQTDLPMILVTEELYQQLVKIYCHHFELKDLYINLNYLRPALHKDFH